MRMRFFRSSAFLTLSSLLTIALAAGCNGDPSLCSKSYANVTFVGAHNSYAVGSSLSDNQNYDVTTQLKDGVRLLQGQGHNGTNKAGSMLELCHTSCALADGGTLESYLGKVRDFVESNPTEVITILWVNADSMPAANWAKAYESSGLKQYSYAPSTASVTAWPTLQQLIDKKTTVLNFITSQQDFANFPYLMHEWSNVWETSYDNTDYTKFNCELDRGSSASGLYLANHFVYKERTILGLTIDSPDTANLANTNAFNNVNDHAELCAAKWGRYPNYFLVDYYESASGGALRVAALLNNIQYKEVALGNGKTISALKTFFTGSDGIRNIGLVAGGGALLIIAFWIVCCCCCRRRSRRANRRSPMDDVPWGTGVSGGSPKPHTSTFQAPKPTLQKDDTGMESHELMEKSATTITTSPTRKPVVASSFSALPMRGAAGGYNAVPNTSPEAQRPLPSPPRRAAPPYNDYDDGSPQQSRGAGHAQSYGQINQPQRRTSPQRERGPLPFAPRPSPGSSRPPAEHPHHGQQRGQRPPQFGQGAYRPAQQPQTYPPQQSRQYSSMPGYGPPPRMQRPLPPPMDPFLQPGPPREYMRPPPPQQQREWNDYQSRQPGGPPYGYR